MDNVAVNLRPLKKRMMNNHQDFNDAKNQLAVCSPADTASASKGTEFQPPQDQASLSAPSVVVYAAQCSICTKWRILPKGKFEEIREGILEHPFECAAALKISCDDDSDLTQDKSSLWAIERPNIARPPLGWERLLRIRDRREGRFADVNYVTPSGKKLRSPNEVQSYLLEHPDEGKGVDLSQFSFQIPKPLWENYVEQHTHCVLALSKLSEMPQDRR